MHHSNRADSCVGWLDAEPERRDNGKRDEKR
jgi:hypothetical protein